ncbi:MAG TPA: cob(I)yrinic acid a,c-diamide adenosyltransferase [Candidatus Binatia bacterium]|nr:cob(I)yrinic acid a,c-diamide adenosyltransferase [Candidatus Binatia bacterium]
MSDESPVPGEIPVPDETRSGRRSPFDSAVATGRGDDGTTGLLFGGPRVAKDDPRVEAYGTVDEAVAALGIARAQLGLKAQYGVLPPTFGRLDELILRLQRELFVVGAELATPRELADRLRDGETRVSQAMVDGLGEILTALEAAVAIPKEFVVPGETMTSAALEVARTTVRRAERRVVALQRLGLLADGFVVPYLNRLADLLWILARAAEQAEARPATPARPNRRRGPARATTATAEPTTEPSTRPSTAQPPESPAEPAPEVSA